MAIKARRRHKAPVRAASTLKKRPLRAPSKRVQAELGSSWPTIKRMIERMESLPDEVWEGIPTDASKNYQHYLYGHPKQP